MKKKTKSKIPKDCEISTLELYNPVSYEVGKIYNVRRRVAVGEERGRDFPIEIVAERLGWWLVWFPMGSVVDDDAYCTNYRPEEISEEFILIECLSEGKVSFKFTDKQDINKEIE